MSSGCNCSAPPMMGGSRRRYQIGKNRSSRRRKTGGGWFSSIFGSSEQPEQESSKGSSFWNMFGSNSSSAQAPVSTVNISPPTQVQPSFGGSRKRRNGGKHCKTSQYKVGGRKSRKHRTRKNRK